MVRPCKPARPLCATPAPSTDCFLGFVVSLPLIHRSRASNRSAPRGLQVDRGKAAVNVHYRTEAQLTDTTMAAGPGADSSCGTAHHNSDLAACRHHRLLMQVTHFTVNHAQLRGSHLEARKTTMPNITDDRLTTTGVLSTANPAPRNRKFRSLYAVCANSSD